MIVCHCTGATDRKIRREVESGARSCNEIGQRCAAGTRCGGCVSMIQSMIEGRDPMGPLRATQIRAD